MDECCNGCTRRKWIEEMGCDPDDEPIEDVGATLKEEIGADAVDDVV